MNIQMRENERGDSAQQNENYRIRGDVVRRHAEQQAYW